MGGHPLWALFRTRVEQAQALVSLRLFALEPGEREGEQDMAKKRYTPYDQPVPQHLLQAILAHGIYCKEDFGFDDSLQIYVERAKANDNTCLRLVEDFKEAFKEILRGSVTTFHKKEATTGRRLYRNERGDEVEYATGDDGEPLERVNMERSQFDTPEEDNRDIERHNPAMEKDFWYKYVDRKWLEIAPNIKFFDIVPSFDPQSSHNKDCIERALHPFNPRREKAIRFLVEHGFRPYGVDVEHINKVQEELGMSLKNRYPAEGDHVEDSEGDIEPVGAPAKKPAAKKKPARGKKGGRK